MLVLGVLFNLPSGWEMAKGVAEYAIPFGWLLLKMTWPIWVILIAFKLIQLFFERRILVFIEQVKNKFRRK